MNTTGVGSSDRRSRFLLIVDSDANRFYAAMLLQRLEYNICTAKTAEEALEMTSVSLPTLIITEMKLAGMSGLELTRRLQAHEQTVFKEAGMGLKFTRITPQAQGLIRQYIKDEITKGIRSL
jgi:CheY-like chemotaxis protein